jgi:hypothetical protein
VKLAKMPGIKRDDAGSGSRGKKTKRGSFVGIMEPYTLGEDFEVYLQHFNNYMELNGVDNSEYKIQLLTNLIGPVASLKISKACKPHEPKNFTYAQIISKCKTIFCGERWSIAEHFKFNNRNQHERESASNYSIELQAIAEHCVFGEFLDTALRDRFVAGLKSSKVKAKILNGAKDSKFDVIVQMAASSELV